VGAEYEFHTFSTDLRPVSFGGIGGAAQLLGSFVELGDWEIKESLGELPLALKHKQGQITLEPGCQIEFSSAPRPSLFELKKDLDFFLQQLMQASGDQFNFCSLGVNPLYSSDQIPLLPKPRYRIMNEHFENTGTMGSWMMRATASQQVCVDFSSESDLMRKLYLGFALAPFSRALFANSPFKEGKPCEMKNFRNHIWRNTDPQRAGIPKSTFRQDLSLQEYCRQVLSVPAMFQVKEEGSFESAHGNHFLTIAEERGWAQKSPTQIHELMLQHLSQSFVEARIKGYLELRTPDAQLPRFLMTPSAFYKGIFCCEQSIEASLQLLKPYKDSEILDLFNTVSVGSLQTPLKTFTILDIVKDMIEISRAGLRRQAESNPGKDESQFLDPLSEIVFENGYSPADFAVRMYEKDCSSDIRKFLKAAAITEV